MPGKDLAFEISSFDILTSVAWQDGVWCLVCARLLRLCAVPSPAAETATSPLKRGEVTGSGRGMEVQRSCAARFSVRNSLFEILTGVSWQDGVWCLVCARVLWLCAVPSPGAETATSPLKRGEVTGVGPTFVLGLCRGGRFGVRG